MEDLKNLKKNLIDSHKQDRKHYIDSLNGVYSESNQGELLVATGVFALIINFFINKKDLNHPLLLVCGSSLLVFTIIVKSLIHRRRANRLEREIGCLDDLNNIDVRITDLILKMKKGINLSDDEKREISNYAINRKKIEELYNNLKKNKFGYFINDMEAVTYVFGLLAIFWFFIFNIIN